MFLFCNQARTCLLNARQQAASVVKDQQQQLSNGQKTNKVLGEIVIK